MSASSSIGIDNIVVRSRGDVSALERGYGREKIARLIGLSSAPVRSAVITLAAGCSGDSARGAAEAEAEAEAELAVDGRTVHAAAAGATVFDAVHELERALRLTFRALAVPCAGTTG